MTGLNEVSKQMIFTDVFQEFPKKRICYFVEKLILSALNRNKFS